MKLLDKGENGEGIILELSVKQMALLTAAMVESADRLGWIANHTQECIPVHELSHEMVQALRVVDPESASKYETETEEVEILVRETT